MARGRRQSEDGDGRLTEDERAELVRLRRENAELAMRCDALKRSGHHAVLAAAEDSALRLGAERRAGVVPGLGGEGFLPAAR